MWRAPAPPARQHDTASVHCHIQEVHDPAESQTGVEVKTLEASRPACFFWLTLLTAHVLQQPYSQFLEMKISKITGQDRSLWHVLGAATACLVIVGTGVLDTVRPELGYSHYAEKPVPGLPGFLAMPFNSLINLGYIILGIYWLAQDEQATGVNGRYLKNVFSWMAVVYGPVQWARIWTQAQRAAVLDQWFTLPIFAWAIIWCHHILNSWGSKHFLAVEFFSLSSYFLSKIHPQGFELALAIHIIWALTSGLRLQRKYGDATTRMYFILAFISCLGFVNLKLLDHWLAQYVVFQRLTGHFWSKICDLLQFHYAFRFLTHLGHRRSIKMKK